MMGPKMILVDALFSERPDVAPCGISYLASYLRQQGFDIELFSANIRGFSAEQASDWIVGRRPDIVGLPILSSLSQDKAGDLIHGLRTAGYQGLLCVGGHWPTVDGTAVLNSFPEADFAIIGDGELTCARLLSMMRRDEEWHSLPGLMVRDADGRPVFNGPLPDAHSQPLDDYPMIALDLIREVVNRYGPSVRVSVVSSRGCYANCSYCSIQSFNRIQGVKRYRLRPMPQFVSELQECRTELGVRHFYIEDDNFMLPGKAGMRRALEFASLVRERGLDDLWIWLETRPECVAEESILALKEAGLRCIFIGIESFDQRTLDLYNRGVTVEQNVRALEILENCGFSCDLDQEFRVRVGLMVFHPYLTIGDLHNQLQYYRRFRIPTKKIIKRLRRAEGTSLWKRMSADLPPGPGKEYPFIHPEVQCLYRLLRQFSSEFMTHRDSVRTIEKKVAIHRLQPDFDLDAMRQFRVLVDRTFIDLIESLCICAREDEASMTEAYRSARDSIVSSASFATISNDLHQVCGSLSKYSIID